MSGGLPGPSRNAPARFRVVIDLEPGLQARAERACNRFP
jgi:hypothetical protein